MTHRAGEAPTDPPSAVSDNVQVGHNTAKGNSSAAGPVDLDIATIGAGLDVHRNTCGVGVSAAGPEPTWCKHRPADSTGDQRGSGAPLPTLVARSQPGRSDLSVGCTYSRGVHPARLGRELPVLPGRLQRLADELADEGLPVLDDAADPVGALVELAYALRPQLHERRVPTYGVLIPPTPFDVEDGRLVGADSAELIAVTDLDVQFARRFADGRTSFALRSSDAITHLACFARNVADEYDLVGLQTSLGGLIIQRHPDGQVRVFGPAGVVRWNGIAWHHDAPIDAWIGRLAAVADDVPLHGVRPLLRFAIHELAGRRIGATLIWRPTDEPVPDRRHEPLVHNAPRLRLDRVGEEAAIANALSQTDGAAIFDGDASLAALGIRLAPSADADQRVGSMRGMRHTSALRYSFDDPDAVVIVVSEDGPVTLMHGGRAITTVDPSDERIG